MSTPRRMKVGSMSVIEGHLVCGLGQSANFTQIDWVRRQLIDLAVSAVCRMDAIDSKLAAGDMRNVTADGRKRMLERDEWLTPRSIGTDFRSPTQPQS